MSWSFNELGPCTTDQRRLKNTFTVSSCMLDASLFAGFFESDPTLELQKMLMKVALAKSADDLRSLESKISHSVNESDVVMANTPDTASLSPIFLASLAPKKNRIPPAEFGAFLRWFLRVPQLPKLSNESVYAHLDYAAETCLGGHCQSAWDRIVDLHGDHANSNCPPHLAEDATLLCCGGS